MSETNDEAFAALGVSGVRTRANWRNVANTSRAVVGLHSAMARAATDLLLAKQP